MYSKRNVYSVTQISLFSLIFAVLGFVYITDFAYSEEFQYEYGHPASSYDSIFVDLNYLTVDSSNNVYATDTKDHNIQKFDSNGNFITKWGSNGNGDGQFNIPQGITIDSTDNVYVADHNNARIQKFDSNGNFITKWGSNGNGDGQFSLPHAIAVDSEDNVYVSELWNYRIQKFDSNGNFITKWGSNGNGDGQFKNPRGITVDSDNNVYVSDNTNNSIQKFDSDGNFIKKWSTGNSIKGLAVDSTDSIYAMIYSQNKIQKFDNDGNIIRSWGTFGIYDGEFQYESGIAVDSEDNVYAGGGTSNKIQKFDSDGGFLFSWASPLTGNGSLNQPRSISVDSEGNVYVVDFQNHQIQKFDGDGNYITKWGRWSVDFVSMWAMGIDSFDNVFILDSEKDNISKYDKNGNILDRWKYTEFGDGSLTNAVDVDFDLSDNMYVGTWGSIVQIFDSDGNLTKEWGTQGTGDGQLSAIRNIAVDSSGKVYVADIHSRVQKFDNDGNHLFTVGTNGYGNGSFRGTPGIAVDSLDNLYATDNLNHRVQVFDSDGNFIEKWGGYGTGDGQFRYPEYITVDSSGVVYASDTRNHRIQVFTTEFTSIPPPDQDNDGIPDISDDCPTEPETYNEFEDTDGCPDGIIDNEPPILIVPDEILRKTNDENGMIVDFNGIVSATDNVGILSNPVCTPQSGDLFPIGETAVDCIVDDINGNSSQDSFVIKIEFDTGIIPDSNPPTVTVPGDILKEATSKNGTTVEFSDKVIATDDIDVVQGPSCTPKSGSIFPIGETIVTCKAFDAYGNNGTASFQITIFNIASSITIIAPSDITIEATKKNMSVNDISFGMPIVLGTDDPNPKIINNAPSIFTLGTTSIIWAVSDNSGKTATITQNITVQDTTDPKITILTPVQGEILSDSDTVIIKGISSDNLGDSDKVEISVNGGKFESASGTTSNWSFNWDLSKLDDDKNNISINARATDESGNVDEHQVIVKIKHIRSSDNVAPIVTVPGDITKEATSKNGTTVEFQNMVAATDNVSVTQGPTCDYASGSIFPIGETIVTCKAFDANRNSGVNSFKIIVMEPEPQFIDPSRGVQYYIETYNNDPSFRNWFDIEYPDITITQYFVVNELALNPNDSPPIWNHLGGIFGHIGSLGIFEMVLIGAIVIGIFLAVQYIRKDRPFNPHPGELKSF